MTHAPSAAYVAQEQDAYTALLAAGVTLGTPVLLSPEEARFGHIHCAFHLVRTADGYDVDGASASAILSLLTDGTYGGQASDYTLRPIEGRA